MTTLRRLCVFCGSSFGARPEYAEAARALGRLLAARGIGIVYGGGNVGLMGAMADAAIEAGGEVTGVIPRALLRYEVGHTGLAALHVVETMHERKAMMADLSDAFVALPGGFGTLEEFAEVLTWSQLGFHPKPCGLLNVARFWDPLLALLEHFETQGFVRPAHRDLVLSDADPASLLAKLADFIPADIPKLIRDSQR